MTLLLSGVVVLIRLPLLGLLGVILGFRVECTRLELPQYLLGHDLITFLLPLRLRLSRLLLFGHLLLFSCLLRLLFLLVSLESVGDLVLNFLLRVAWWYQVHSGGLL